MPFWASSFLSVEKVDPIESVNRTPATEDEMSEGVPNPSGFGFEPGQPRHFGKSPQPFGWGLFPCLGVVPIKSASNATGDRARHVEGGRGSGWSSAETISPV